METKKTGPQTLLIIGPNLFFSQSNPTHSPELIFQIINMSQETHLFPYLCYYLFYPIAAAMVSEI